jgi:hypothetical protein
MSFVPAISAHEGRTDLVGVVIIICTPSRD